MAFNSPGTPIAATLDSVEVCFEPSSYGDDGTATRVNIVFRPSEAIAADLEQLDAWLLRTAAENSLAWFGKQKSVDQLGESYTPILKQTKYGPQFKAKLTLAPPAQTKIWDQQKQVRAAPESWKAASVKPRLHMRGVYFMGAQFGAVMECTDVQILEEAASSCPF